MKTSPVFWLAVLLVLSSVVASYGAQLPHVTGGVEFSEMLGNDMEKVGKAEFNAIATDREGSAKGWFKFRDFDGNRLRMEVECLDIHEDVAMFGGWAVAVRVGKNGDFPDSVWVQVWVKDGGSPGTAGDAISAAAFGAHEEIPCDATYLPDRWWQVTSGNLTIHRKGR